MRIETPFGPRAFFTDSTRVRLTGELRNADVTALPRVFIPGFPQAVTVSAVDSNYYDWYRTHNNAFSGAGLFNRVQGGLGMFGSLVRLRFEDLHVVAPQTEPAAGTFRFVGPPPSWPRRRSFAWSCTSSPAARGDQADALSGRYAAPNFGTGVLTCGLLGSARNGQVELALLRDWSARDTVEMFVGEFRGDTMVGTYRGAGGNARYVKRR